MYMLGKEILVKFNFARLEGVVVPVLYLALAGNLILIISYKTFSITRHSLHDIWPHCYQFRRPSLHTVILALASSILFVQRWKSLCSPLCWQFPWNTVHLRQGSYGPACHRSPMTYISSIPQHLLPFQWRGQLDLEL